MRSGAHAKSGWVLSAEHSVAVTSTLVVSTFGGVVGGSIAGLLVVGFTELLKAMLAVVSRQNI